MKRFAVLTLQELEFSAGHFTIFSETEREDMHGHNYSVSADLEVEINENGMAFDYRIYKNKLKKLTEQLDRRFLLPAHSPYLIINDEGDFWMARFAAERIPFLKRDVHILPISNVTIEELSHWFLQKLTEDCQEIQQYHIHKIVVKVSNGPGQWGASEFEFREKGKVD